LHAAEAEDHPVQMAQVFGFDDELDDCLAIVVVVNVDSADIGIVI
jgi:hypothetical protein